MKICGWTVINFRVDLFKFLCQNINLNSYVREVQKLLDITLKIPLEENENIKV